jgi:hypothetical protein
MKVNKAGKIVDAEYFGTEEEPAAIFIIFDAIGGEQKFGFP